LPPVILAFFEELLMRFGLRLMVMAAVLGISSAAFAELVDNPEYAHWAKYKAGTFVSYKQATDMPGMANIEGMPPGMNMAAMMPQITMTSKLTEVKPDALTLETTMATTQMGQTRDNKTTRTVPAKIEKAEIKPTSVDGVTAEMKNVKEGKDSVEVKGKKIDTITREFDTVVTSSEMSASRGRGRGDSTTMTAHMKVWSSTEVPGNMVKSETTTKMEEMGDVKQTMTLVDYSVVK
jgi:hypothetical protein